MSRLARVYFSKFRSRTIILNYNRNLSKPISRVWLCAYVACIYLFQSCFVNFHFRYIVGVGTITPLGNSHIHNNHRLLDRIFREEVPKLANLKMSGLDICWHFFKGQHMRFTISIFLFNFIYNTCNNSY